MSQGNYGATAAMIDKINDIPTLQKLLHDPRYAGFTAVIIAKMTDINHTRQSAQAQQPPAPSVAQQTEQGAPPPPAQAMASGGIVAFRHGGKVKKYAAGGATRYQDEYGRPVNSDYPGARPVPDNNPSAEVMDTARVPAPSGMHSYFRQTPTAKAPAAGAVLPPKQQRDTPPPADTPAYTPGVIRLPTNSSDSGIGGLSVRGKGSPNISDESSDAMYRRIQARLGDNPDVAEERAALAQDRARAPWMGVMRAGLGMAQSASQNPHYGILGNLAAGAGEGLTDYSKGQEEQNKHLSELAKISRAERIGASSQAEQEYNANTRARAQEYGANQRAAIAAHSQNKQYELENSLAMQAANEMKARDVKLHGAPQMSDMDYLEKGRQRFVSGIVNANTMAAGRDAANETRMRGVYENAKTKFQATHGATDFFPSYESWSQAGGADAPTVIRE